VLFKNNLPPEWEIGAQGGYFAFVRHPFEGVRAESLAQELVEKEGLLALPATFFTPTTTTKHQGEEETMREPRNDDDVQENERWLRFSVANVDDGKVLEACTRLAAFHMQS
jgi:aspartate/methionine/tyrosine aminotransferase